MLRRCPRVSTSGFHATARAAEFKVEQAGAVFFGSNPLEDLTALGPGRGSPLASFRAETLAEFPHLEKSSQDSGP